MAQGLILLLLANPGLAAAAAAAAASPAATEKTAETTEPVTFTVEKPTKEATGETATPLNESSDLSASGKRISDQEKLNSFGNRLLAYYLQRGQKGGPSWLKTTDIQLRFTQDNQPLYSFETIQPFGDIRKDGSLWFWQGRYAHLNLDNGSTANLGIGWRKLSADKTSLVGLNLFYDYGFQYDLQRVGIGAEYFHKQMEYRFNYYRPISGDKQTGLEVQSGGILYSYIRAVEGFDYELGTSLPDAPWWKVYVGGYHWNNKYNPDENGYRLRSTMQLTPRVAVEIGYQSSNLTSEAYGKVTYNIADILGSSFWGTPVVNAKGEIIGYSVQIYQNGKAFGNPIVIPAVTMHDHFALKATPMTKGDKPLAAAAHLDGDISYKMLQKVERQNDIKTEKFTKLVSYSGSVNIRVTDGANPISGAIVSATLLGVAHSATTDATGIANFSNLPTGTFTFTASATGFVSGSSSVTVSSTGGSGTITLGSNMYNITASAGSNGSIASGSTTINGGGSGSVSVAYGSSQTFTFTPSSGYQVSSVTVDGTSLGATPTSYTFTKVISAHTLDVAFESIPTVLVTLQKVGKTSGSSDYNANSYTISYVLHGISYSTDLIGCMTAGACADSYATTVRADVGSYVTVTLIGPISQTFKFYVYNKGAYYQLS
ncbi:MAG TPA: inverse autotransporter beta domain-containing protein [Negativicutes bacterium]|nr:inverse autotransporter beta domain-containing protein [Negativicutes bacterium]